ncbi:hypothetical protein EYF80_024132 [Liparis tanakae]|uniref:Uncharacterized protein n=1 Tax=Liparis tanakae TaxID=230148 RepID=A0A4Z2HKU2_9TELE|nr:hypothetical protein EYF80_024132 [Liparis tanakae]
MNAVHEDIIIEPLVQIANGNQCSVKPLRNDHGLDQHPASTSKEPPDQVGGGVCARFNTSPSSISNRKRPKRSVGTMDLRSYSSRGCQPTEPPDSPDCGYGPPKATVSCARPLSAATGPSQDLRPAATACKERHQMDTIQKNNQ